MTEMTKSGPEADQDLTSPTKPQSTAYANVPKLSHRALTGLLVCMCVVPVVLLTTLFVYLPEVNEGELPAAISAAGLPAASFYDQDYDQRPDVPSGELIVRNEGDQDWTHLNIQVNRHYQIYERNPIPAGEARRFQLDRFVTRTGATFDVRYNPLKFVRIYARLPTKERATFAGEYDWQSVK